VPISHARLGYSIKVFTPQNFWLDYCKYIQENHQVWYWSCHYWKHNKIAKSEVFANIVKIAYQQILPFSSGQCIPQIIRNNFTSNHKLLIMLLNNLTSRVKLAPGANFTGQVRLVVFALWPSNYTQDKLAWSLTDWEKFFLQYIILKF
jgi:hypothetical protein